MSEHKKCSAYRAGEWACSNGFIQTGICRGRVISCFSCGAISERYSTPHCLNEKLPAYWLTEGGKPLFVPKEGS